MCILVKTDEVCAAPFLDLSKLNLFPLKINRLFHMILYVRKNEETSCLKIIHFYEEEKGIPSELEANAKSRSIEKWVLPDFFANSLQSLTKRFLK